MAKGKHSTALFEVIHSGKKPDRVAQSLRTPKWWFKSSHQSRASTPPPPAPAPSDEEPQRVEDERQEIAEETPATRFRPSRDRSSGIRFGFNRNNQEFTFKLRYTTALVTGFGVCVLVGLSYVVGRHLGGGPKVASAEQASVKELLQQPAQPDVTKVTPRARVSATQTPAQRSSTPATSPDRSGSPALANNSVAPRSNMTSSFVPASADTTMPRKVGLNYLVLGTYPTDRKQIAEAARDYLTKNGISCTLEKTEWAPGKWITLVGTAGFKRVSTDDFKSYLQHAATLAKGFKASNFDQPQPTSQTVYKWGGMETPVN